MARRIPPDLDFQITAQITETPQFVNAAFGRGVSQAVTAFGDQVRAFNRSDEAKEIRIRGDFLSFKYGAAFLALDVLYDGYKIKTFYPPGLSAEEYERQTYGIVGYLFGEAEVETGNPNA